jgi:D-alanyl-D-alanine endopeptidase (penicillin-binding protein 7)
MTALVLFNGLWQGALLAAAAYAISLTLPARDAVTRYALWLTTLVAIAAFPVVSTLLRGPFAFHNFVASSVASGQVSIALVALSTQTTNRGAHLAALVPWLVVLWAICVAFNLCRLIRGALHMTSIARNARTSAPGLDAPDVFVSDEIDMPLVAGVVAPRILIPSAMCRTLDAIDLQRIIAHERAHVRRNDPWFNLLVRTIEAVLFFNPSLYFVVRKLAEEREAACDDAAIAQGGQSFDYAACLAAIAQSRPRRVEVTPAALGFRTSLLSRIERLQSAQPRITTINRKALAGIVMLFAIIGLALQTLTPALALSIPVAQGAQLASVVAASCAQRNVEAGVLTPQPPELPRGFDLTGSAQAVVTIAVTGRVAMVRILHSSGNRAIDAAVLFAARHSTYRPKIVNCVAVEGSYIFRVDFKP